MRKEKKKKKEYHGRGRVFEQHCRTQWWAGDWHSGRRRLQCRTECHQGLVSRSQGFLKIKFNKAIIKRIKEQEMKVLPGPAKGLPGVFCEVDLRVKPRA